MNIEDTNTDGADLDNLLDMTLDDLADMPEFKPFPAGAHKVLFAYESKKVNEVGAVQFTYTYVEPIELVDSTDAVPKAKDTANILCMMKNKDGTKNEFSEGTIKMHAAALKERFPGNKVGEIFNAANGSEIMIVTTIKEGKDKVKRMAISAVSVI